MKYLLDTNTVSYFMRGEPAVVGRLNATLPDLIAVSVVTVMELEYGLQINPIRARKLAPLLDALLASIETLSYAPEDARITAALRASLRKAGKPVGAYDVMIAGTAMRHGRTLVTSNTKEFSQISGLVLEDWRAK